jgi:hypothetical protein
MEIARNPFALAVVLAVAAAALFVILEPGDSDDSDGPVVTNSASSESEAKPAKKKSKPKRPAVPTVVVRDGTPVDGVLGVEVDQGDEITFKVKSDVDEEVHVHGFDISKDVAAGGTARLSFPATITGIFEVELEYSGVPIAELQVNP